MSDGTERTLRVLVNRDGIDKGVAEPIQIVNLATGHVTTTDEVWISGEAYMVFRPDAPLADGTRVWIECRAAYVKRDGKWTDARA